MKTKSFFVLMVIALLCSCDRPSLLDEKEYVFQIFRYTDETNKELIITAPYPFADPGSPATFASGIINFPKRYRDEPYFFGIERWEQNPEKYTFDICELATEEKLLALHDHYYTYFPYTGLRQYGQDVVRDGKWSDICKVDPLKLPVLMYNANSLYSEIRKFEIRTLEKLTKKKRDEMTINDIEKAINKVIDEGKLDKYSVKVDTFWASRR